VEIEMASIIIVTGSNKGDYYPLGHRTTVIGRDEAVPVQILDSKVSRKHMQIRFNEDKKFSAVDMSSKHGVFINGDKITGETELKDND
jgi:pSer/pThr/pTyr-binding forkhead associated (FHA) protein